MKLCKECAFFKFIRNNFHNKKFPEGKFISLFLLCCWNHILSTRCYKHRFMRSCDRPSFSPLEITLVIDFEIRLDTVGVKQWTKLRIIDKDMVCSFASSRLWEVSNSRSGLSFVELRRERGAHSSDLRHRDALKIALQGALFIPRDSWKRQIALYVRVYCASQQTVVHSRSRAK